ncbi:MAG: RnfABCDGE type electron transport complex subunit B [Clostridia bacterium]|nr:RnfABCDGE type electron transport complex subunit B [Clostridia bacterium]
MFILLAPINVSKLFIVVGIVAAIAVIFAVLIVLVSRLTAVKSDRKTEEIQDLLAGANCGGCGYAGCSDFAKALTEGKADVSACGPTAKENKAEIAAKLSVPFSATEDLFAIVHCAGGINCNDKFDYVGNQGCIAKSSFAGGNKECPFGCLGDGSCVKACDFDAITVKDGVAATDKEKCAACGKCVKTCPKRLIGFIPKKAKVYIACSSLCRGKDVINACKKGCIGCGICAKACPALAITITDNLPVIDYTKCTGCTACAEKCPRKCIVKI